MRKFLTYTALAALFLAVAGVSAYVTLTLIIKSEQTVIVPRLVGKEVVSALQLLSDLELNTRVKGTEFHPQIPANHVIHQDPEPGAEIKKDRNVQLVLSMGTETVAVPNLAGSPLRHARIFLEENGLCAGVTARGFSPIVDRDAVLAQYPAAGNRVARAQCVDLLVSDGPRPAAWKMPELVGLPLDEALLRIDVAGLVPGEVRSRSQANRVRNTVLDQEPLPGSRVLEGARVRITVNRTLAGSEPISGMAGVGLFRHRLAPGFLKRHIRIQLNAYGESIDLVDDYIRPGQEVWALIPRHNDATVLLYEDDELVRTELFP